MLYLTSFKSHPVLKCTQSEYLGSLFALGWIFFIKKFLVPPLVELLVGATTQDIAEEAGTAGVQREGARWMNLAPQHCSNRVRFLEQIPRFPALHILVLWLGDLSARLWQRAKPKHKRRCGVWWTGQGLKERNDPPKKRKTKTHA